MLYRIGLLPSSDDNDSDLDVDKKKLSEDEDDDGIPSFDEGEAEAEVEEKERSPTRKTSKLLKKKRLSNEEVQKVLDSSDDADTPVKKRCVRFQEKWFFSNFTFRMSNACKFFVRWTSCSTICIFFLLFPF